MLSEDIGLKNQFVKNEHKFSPAPSNFSVGFLVLARKLSWSDLYKSSAVESHRFISFFLYRKNSFSTVFCATLRLLCCMLPYKDFYTYGCDHDEKQTCTEKHTCQTWIQFYAKRHFILLNGLYNEVKRRSEGLILLCFPEPNCYYYQPIIDLVLRGGPCLWTIIISQS